MGIVVCLNDMLVEYLVIYSSKLTIAIDSKEIIARISSEIFRIQLRASSQ
jgi:hypothetical protein